MSLCLTLGDLERSSQGYLHFEGAELGQMLLSNTNRKSCLGVRDNSTQSLEGIDLLKR